MIIPRILPNIPNANTRVGAYLVAAIWLLLSALISTAQTSTPPQTDTARKQSTIHGRVIYEDTRRPLRRVQVSVYDPAGRGNARHFTAWTDGRGEFQIKDVPAGKYFVEVSAPGIIRSGLYDSEEKQRDLTSVTTDGSSKSEVLVRVRRGGAISGKVNYADGEPAINTAIRVLRKQEGKWAEVYVDVVGGRDRVITDDRGMYRVSGLTPGEYLVVATEERWGIELSAQDRPDGTNMLNRAQLTTTYYDGATSLAGATVLTIQAGEEQKDINITLADRPSHSISGTVTLKGNTRPVVRARMSLKRKDESPPFASDLDDPVTNTDDQGRFTFEEVQDGSYTLTIVPARNYSRYDESSAPSPPDTSQKFVGKHLELSVSGADLADLNIEVFSGSHISGTVAVENGKPLPGNVSVYAEAIEGQAQSATAARVQPDGAFTLAGVPAGITYLRSSVPPNNQYYTKSVTVEKTELLRRPLDVKEEEDINNVRIVISPDLAVLSGRALASDGKTPQAGASVLLLSADPDQQKSASGRIFGFTNADGSFRVSGAPGEYFVIVTRRGESPWQLGNDALRSRAANAQRIVLQPGENGKVEIVAPSDK